MSLNHLSLPNQSEIQNWCQPRMKSAIIDNNLTVGTINGSPFVPGAGDVSFSGASPVLNEVAVYSVIDGKSIKSSSVAGAKIQSTLDLPSLSAKSILSLNAANRVSSNVLSDGQLLIGNTGNNPTIASLTGTSNQVIVSNGSGTITLSTPQNIGTGSTPTFSNITLNSLTGKSSLSLNASKNLVSTVLTNGQILIGNTGNDVTASTITGTTSQVTVTNGPGTITLSLPQNINSTASPTFNSLSLNGVTVKSVLTLNASNIVTGNVLNNGNLLIGSTGNVPVVASLSSGSAEGIIITSGAGSIQIDTAQDISVNSAPSFSQLSIASGSFVPYLFLGNVSTAQFNSGPPTDGVLCYNTDSKTLIFHDGSQDQLVASQNYVSSFLNESANAQLTPSLLLAHTGVTTFIKWNTPSLSGGVTYNAGTGEYKVPTTGLYLITANTNIDNSSGFIITQAFMFIYLNMGALIGYTSAHSVAVGGTVLFSGSAIYPLSANDTISIAETSDFAGGSTVGYSALSFGLKRIQ